MINWTTLLTRIADKLAIEKQKPVIAKPRIFGNGAICAFYISLLRVGRLPNPYNIKPGSAIARLLPLAILLLLLSGCELYEQDEYEEYYVVESYLVVDAPLPQVRLSTNLPVDEEYSFAKAAVSDADVSIQLLDDAGNPSANYPYEEQRNGVYTSADNETTIRGARRYRLSVRFQDGDTLRAETLVPGDFETQSVNRDTVTYQAEPQFKATTTQSAYPGRQSYYIFTVNAVDPIEENLTPLYADFVEDEDELSDFEVNSSGIINEGNYDLNSDQSITVSLPWLGVAFYGDNDVIINAIDDNMYDFLRSQSVQGGGAVLSPGEIQNIRYNIEGGIGVFGSMASDTNRVFVRKPPGL